MNETDTVVIVTAAFGGGLFGAVLQPLLSYGLQKLTAKDDRRKRVEKHLRRMLTVWLGYALRAAIVAMEIVERRKVGLPPLAEKDIYSRADLGVHFPAWEPERIQDPALRKAAEKLYDTINPLTVRLFDPNASDQWLDEQGMEIGRLRKAIIVRMDELDWPESD